MFFPWVFNCSTAPALKLSQAANITENPALLSIKATLAKLVDLPTPLTPMKTMTYGLCVCFALATSAMILIYLAGVRIFTRASLIDDFTVAWTLVKLFVLVSSKVCPTDWVILFATSWATFLSMSWVLNIWRIGSRSSCVMLLFPITFWTLLTIFLKKVDSLISSSLSTNP